MDYLKIGKATELTGSERRLYRILEIFPGFLSLATLIVLLALSYLKPVWVAYFIIAFDVYWLLLVVFLGIHLLASYVKMKKNIKIDWRRKCEKLTSSPTPLLPKSSDGEKTGKGEQGRFAPAYLGEQTGARYDWQEIYHLIILPFYEEGLEIIRPTLQALIKDGYPTDKLMVVLAAEKRAGEVAFEKAKIMEQEFSDKFKHFLVTIHPDNIVGEIKGKGANQAWAAKQAKKEIIDRYGYDYDKILVSVFDIDTVIRPGYFFVLTYKFLTALNPYRASYQPIPVYHNNLWRAPFFARVAASSNTFWQMMQQIRQEKLATYSSHSMTFKTLIDIDFWSTNMVNEDSRIFWHCFCFYRGDYRVEPLYFPVSMDVVMDETVWQSVKSLYKQQRRWGYGVENIPYLIFNTIKNWRIIPRWKFINRILIQLYGFHSWATNALIIAVIGWMPLILGGNRFNVTVLSSNLPMVTRTLMTVAMVGLVFSAIISTLLLPKRPVQYGLSKSLAMILQWLILPLSIIIFGAIPALEAQTRLMLGKYLGFWVTPKTR